MSVSMRDAISASPFSLIMLRYLYPALKHFRFPLWLMTGTLQADGRPGRISALANA